MGLFDELLGGNRDQYQDYVNRYDQGAPYEGISDDEALQRYRQVDEHLDDDEYENSARDAFSRMSPDDRAPLGQHLSQGGWEASDDPGILARQVREARQGNPDLLSSLLGGGGGGLGGLLGGGGAGGLGGLGGGSVGKAALGGIAAMAMKRLMSR